MVGSAADDRGVQPDQLGFAASAFMAGIALVNFGGFLWLRRYNWRWLVGIGNLLATIAFLVPVYSFSATTWTVCNLLAGMAVGITYGVSLACLGDTNQPERNFAIAYLGQTILAAATIFLLPRIASGLDIFSIGHWFAAGFMIVGIAFVRMIPTHGAKSIESKSAKKLAPPLTMTPAVRAALIMALGVLLLNVMAEGAIWTFLERIAVSQGHDSRFAANVISASFLTAGVGSLIAAVIGQRMGRTKPFLLAVAVSIISVLMFWIGGDAIVYVIAVLLFAAAWNLGSPYRMALAVSADPTGRYTTLVPAMQTLGAALGPALAGVLIVGDSFTHVYALSIGLWVVTVILFLAASRRLKQS